MLKPNVSALHMHSHIEVIEGIFQLVELTLVKKGETVEIKVKISLK